MKFQDFLMQRYSVQQERLHLEEEVAELQEALEKELKLKHVLECIASHQNPIVCCSCLSSILPLEVQVLLAEIAMVEEEIIVLERQVEGLKLHLYQERANTNEWNLQKQRNFLYGLKNRKEIEEVEESLPFPNREITSRIHAKETSDNLSFVTEISSVKRNDEEAESSRRCNKQKENQSFADDETSTNTPNRLSEELIKILIRIFHKLNERSNQVNCESANLPKLNISCMSSKGFVCKSSFNPKMPLYSSRNTMQMLDPSGKLEADAMTRETGPYKKFIQLTRSSMDITRLSLCLPDIERLRIYMHKLSTVELSFMTYKQKLAFWINIYNACIMHAFLTNGPPSSQDKMLALLNKAAVNVGGVVLNALAIEHFILRHSSDNKNAFVDENEALLRHAYGLCYPEPNVTFALCRGSWSSPALRVYSAENVVNELEKAKIEYLEASVGTSSKKICMPKLLHWHMQDFADDVESLLEWIYSQLPRSVSLKRSIMECLSRDTKVPLSKMVEIKPYEAQFRYLLPSLSST